MNVGLAPQPIVDAGLAPQPLMNWDPLIVELAVILNHRPSVIEPNPLRGVAIVVGLIALWTILCRQQFDPFFPAVLEEWTSSMSFVASSPLFSFSCFLLLTLELIDQHLRRDRSLWLHIFFSNQQPFSFDINSGCLYLGINNSFLLRRFRCQQLNTC
jgi:hypothetical protein